ncbi:hypothetical protein [Isoptericola dokdonensis]|uniref:Uncharacterized protein n=1 Tax=Isoptericola dokdonensis DS-3 TaxID=1300344 RepID=A0A168FMU7_9MICO|nr:hypothetical protein [Isoptericola dokdonensis]ANC32160.1 hypothetical protein I598_2630 [Isoptericola dokdonensis DS-3]
MTDDVYRYQTFYRTKARGRLHVMGCSHLPSADPSDFVLADAADLADLAVCTECDKEIRGIGRIPYESLDAAFEDVKLPVENRPRMREIAAELDYTRIWAPQGRSYVAVGHLDGRAAAAYFTHGHVDVRVDDATYRREEMPNFTRTSGRGGRVAATERPAAVCPTCAVQLPATGLCDDCD